MNRKIFHRVGERYSRPIRGSRRQRIKEKFRAGGSVYRVHAEYDQQRTENEKRGFNYDATGKSKKVFKKIKAESVSESLLSPDFQIGMSPGILELFIVEMRRICIYTGSEKSRNLFSIVDRRFSTLSFLLLFTTKSNF